MHIQQAKVTIAPVRAELAPVFGSLVADPAHRISVLGSGRLAAVAAASRVGGQQLRGVTGLDLTAGQRIKLETAFVAFGSAVAPQIKKLAPTVSGQIDGIEFVLASKVAFDSWTDPERKSTFKPAIKTARALVELLEASKPILPALSGNGYLDAAGKIVKIGDAVLQLWWDIQASGEPK